MTALTKAEVLAKCNAALVASRDEAAMATVINLGRTKTVLVPIADAQAYLQGNGIWTGIKAAAASATAGPTKDSAAALIDASTARYNNLDMTLPGLLGALSQLVAAGTILQVNKDALIAMSVASDPVSAQQVALALEGI